MKEEAVLPDPSRTGPFDGGGHALILANRLPYPLDDGWKVRTFHVIRGLASRFRVTLLVFHPGRDRETIEAARRALGPRVRLEVIEPPRAYTAANLVRGLVTSVPVHVWNQESAAYRKRIQQILGAELVDVVVIESTFMAKYLELVPRAIPRVVDTHNIDSVTFGRYVTSLRAGPRQWYAAATVRRLAMLEQRTYRDVDSVWVCSEVEREFSGRAMPVGRVRTVPNGVDTRYFAPRGTPADGRMLLFFGRLDYFPNIDGLGFFARDVLPRVRASCPDVRLDVVGSGATREVSELIEGSPSARLVGRVDDLPGVIDAAGIVIVPLRVGGGTRLKVLEALSMAKPVVSTRIGAEGITARDGEHLLLADTPEELAEAIRRLLADPVLAATLGRNGRHLVQASYDWELIGRAAADNLSAVIEAAARA